MNGMGLRVMVFPLVFLSCNMYIVTCFLSCNMYIALHVRFILLPIFPHMSVYAHTHTQHSLLLSFFAAQSKHEDIVTLLVVDADADL